MNAASHRPDEESPSDGDLPEEQRSRTSLKNERVNNEKALSKLGEELLPLSTEQLAQLGASEDLILSLSAAKSIKSFAARKRQLRVVRARLRDEDWTRLRKGLDRLRAGFEMEEAKQRPSTLADQWCEQLLIQGDAGLARFCQEYDHADRTRLRQLIRNTLRAPSLKRGKARLQLERAVLDLVGDDTQSRSQ